MDKWELRNDFKTFCKENEDKELRRDKAEEIWEEYKPYKVKRLKDIKKHHVENIHEKANRDSNIRGVRPSALEATSKIQHVDHLNLDLKNTLESDSKKVLLILNLIGLMLTGVFIIMMVLGTILAILGAMLVIGFDLMISIFVFKSGTSRYKYIETTDQDNRRELNEFYNIQRSFNKILKSRDILYKNGNIKAGVFRDKVNLWYRTFILSLIENPLSVEAQPKPILTRNFPNIGGIYAWYYNEEIVYIGKANNINRRMGEHIDGLTKSGHKEYKYNAGVDVNRLYIKVLALTNDEDEQSVLESYYYDKYNNGRLLNSTGTLSWEKITSKPKYSQAWERIKERS